LSSGIKKWFMLQLWRIQQVAQLLTVAMLALTLSLTVYDYMQWREGTFFGTPYIGVTLILLTLGSIIWAFAIVWDLRLKMWREQMTVAAEKNPYTKEKLTPKEILILGTLWLPMLERLGRDDPNIRTSAEALRKWVLRSMKDNRITKAEVGEVLKYIGDSDSWLHSEKK
jgi:hypothetical protein